MLADNMKQPLNIVRKEIEYLRGVHPGTIIASSSRAQRKVLADIITDNGKGRLMLDSKQKERIIKWTSTDIPSISVGYDIIEEIRTFGSNFIMSVMRGCKQVEYEEVLYDVAVAMGAKPKHHYKHYKFIELEEMLLAEVASKYINEMTVEGRDVFMKTIGWKDYVKGAPITASILILIARSQGFEFYIFMQRIVQAFAKLITGKGLSFLTTGQISKMFSYGLHPVSLIINGAWLAIDLAGPAKRVTVPAVIQIALMRQQLMAEAGLK